MNKIHSMAMIAVISLVTISLRFMPFLIWGGEKKTPAFIEYLGRVLPYAIMGMLCVYCLKDVSPFTAPYGIPSLIAIIFVVLIYKWKRQSLLSIVLGTILYMLLVQVVFPA